MRRNAGWLGVLALVVVGLLAMAACDDDEDDWGDEPSGDDDDDDDAGDDDSGEPGWLDDQSFTDDPAPFVSGLDDRIAEYLANCAAKGLTGTGTHEQVCVLATGAGEVRLEALTKALDKMDNREDTADFRLASLVRMLAKYADDPNFPADVYDRVMESIVSFKYWIDEPGQDGMCYWSENHFMLFNSAAFVLGDLYPNVVFTNSQMTGAQLRAKAREHIAFWLDTRLRWGFSEFHSDVYYNEDGPALLNVADFGNDEEMQTKARMVLDILFLDMALNNHEGLFGVPHGRSYMKDKQSLEKEDTKAMIWVALGKGDPYGDYGSMTAVALCDSDTYRVPAVVESIGSARPRGLVSRERLSITLDDGPSLGIGFDDFDHGMFWWMMGGYVVPQVLGLTFEMADAWNLFYSDQFFGPFEFLVPLADAGILGAVAWQIEPILNGYALEEVNTYVYRTPEVMLASAQDYKPATLGAQTHDWQASAGPTELVFTTYPGDLGDNSFAGHWTGGWHARIAQHRTAAIVLYRKPEIDLDLVEGLIDVILPRYTHAFFPRAEFDEVVYLGHWTLAREGDGYIGLWSMNPTTWQTEGEWANRELVADGPENIWICEVGDTEMYGSFDAFVDAVSHAPIGLAPDLEVTYTSPGQGEMAYSWKGPFMLNGEPVVQSDYPRFSNPYIEKAFDGADPYVVERGDLRLELDPATLTREGGL